MSLSWKYRDDYEKGGYKMLSVVNQQRVPLMSLIYSFATLPLGFSAAYYGITDMSFAFDSLLLDFWLIYKAQIFYNNPNNKTARDLFMVTLKWLPLFMILMMIHHYYQEYTKKDESINLLN
jgi:heme o synthase